MIEMTLEQVAAATAGRLDGGAAADARVTAGVETDSRAVEPGSLFVALAGERVDGHDFAAAACDAGAVAVLADRDLDVPCVVVDDCVAALGRLARAVVDRLGVTVVAVTGSSGKTTTKDMLASVLSQLGPVVAPRGSFNNEVGLPVTALRCDESTLVLVSEMGARGRGHIEYLCTVTPPHISLVLNVGSAHLGEFGSREAIGQAKSEIVRALRPDGVAVLNADDPIVEAMASVTEGRVVTVGEAASAQVRARDVRLDPTGRAQFVLVAGEDSADVRMRLVGEHQVANALSTAAVALELGMSTADVAAALSEVEPASRWRMEVTERADGTVVINDAYNANPESVRAALKALVGIAAGRRTWAVLGEMRELGSQSALEHDAIGRLAVRLNVDRLVAVGEGARAVHLGAAHEGSWGRESMWVPDLDAALRVLHDELEPGDVVLVKGSRLVGLEAVAEELLGPEPAEAPQEREDGS
jgi:UDP-N-acetylmuramoyl-tripeptide--D-alanyl-D-alanine ligase